MMVILPHRARSPRQHLRVWLASELAKLPAGVRPARRRDAFQLAVLFARSIERPRRHPPQARKLIPLRPLRLTVYTLLGLATVAIPDTTLLAGSPSALLAVDEQDRHAHIRRVIRAMGWSAVFALALLPVATLLALALPGLAYDVLQWTISGTLAACGLRLVIANQPARVLRAVGRKWAAELPGSVWWLTGYVSLDPSAAFSLGRAMCELADSVGELLMAVTEGTARVHAYQRAGFTIHRQLHVDHEPCVLLVRWPRSGGKQQSSSSERGPGNDAAASRGSGWRDSNASARTSRSPRK
jgi:hypothetical protein